MTMYIGHGPCFPEMDLLGSICYTFSVSTSHVRYTCLLYPLSLYELPELCAW